VKLENDPASIFENLSVAANHLLKCEKSLMETTFRPPLPFRSLL